MWVEGASAVLPPSCARSRTDIAHHSRALLPSFGPDATASTQVICMDSVAPGPGDWRRRQLPGNPALGGRRHLQNLHQHERPFVERVHTDNLNAPVGAARNLLPGRRNRARGRRGVILASLKGRGEPCVSSSLHCSSSVSSCSRPSWSDRRRHRTSCVGCDGSCRALPPTNPWPIKCEVSGRAGAERLQQTSTYLNATLRGLHESMRTLEQSRAACKSVASTPTRARRPARKQAPASDGNSLIH
jgi:hypothetical protein